MYVTGVFIENVRSFLQGKASTNIEIGTGGPGWHVFAGRNGSGKSTLLRAVALAIAGPEHARVLMPSFAEWVRHEAAYASVVTTLSLAPEDRVQGAGGSPKKPLLAGLLWEARPGSEPELSAWPWSGPPKKERAAKWQARWSQRSKKSPAGTWRGPWGRNPRGWLVAGYGPFRRLSGHAAEAQRVMAGPCHQRRLVSLFREDASLLEAVSWLQDLKFRALEKREGARALLRDVLALLNDGLLPDRAKVVKVDADGLWVRRGRTAPSELQGLSDGYRVALALVLDIVRHIQDGMQADPASSGCAAGLAWRDARVVLVDEIDAHLLVSWQQRIGFWLTEALPSRAVPGHRAQPVRLPGGRQKVVCSACWHRRAEGDAGGRRHLPARGQWHPDAVLSSLFELERTRSPRATRLVQEWSACAPSACERPSAGRNRHASPAVRELPFDL